MNYWKHTSYQHYLVSIVCRRYGNLLAERYNWYQPQITLFSVEHHVTKQNLAFIITPLKCSSQIKGTASHISTIHNSKTEISCQWGHQDTGNALFKRPADRCRHFGSHSGFRSFYRHSVCKLRDIGRHSAWKRNALTSVVFRKHQDSFKNQRIWLF